MAGASPSGSGGERDASRSGEGPRPGAAPIVFGTRFAPSSGTKRELSEWQSDDPQSSSRPNHRLPFGDNGWSSPPLKLIQRLHDVGTQRDHAGNRKLFYDQYAALLLMDFCNTALASLRALQQATG
jgi:hypothetical protein